MIKKRLLALAKFLMGVPDTQFDLETWRKNDDYLNDDYTIVGDRTRGYQITSYPSCRTTMCAVGWGCAMPEFQKLGLRMMVNVDEFTSFYPKFKDFTGFDAVSEFFDISERAAKYLFDIESYDYGEPTSAKYVATRIRKFVDEGRIATIQ